MKKDNKLLTILDKVILYIIFFVLCIQDKHLIHWFSMANMTYAMILMSVVMLVNFGWEVCHAKL